MVACGCAVHFTGRVVSIVSDYPHASSGQRQPVSSGLKGRGPQAFLCSARRSKISCTTLSLFHCLETCNCLFAKQ